MLGFNGAQNGSRTHTLVRAQPPQGCVSTNFTTWAFSEYKKTRLKTGFLLVTWLGLEPRTLSLKGRCSTN